jgi:hypothetical protein
MGLYTVLSIVFILLTARVIVRGTEAAAHAEEAKAA